MIPVSIAENNINRCIELACNLTKNSFPFRCTTQLDEMKLETHWFLKKISAFASQSRTSVDDQLLKMFLDAAQKIADCVDRSDGTTPTKQTNVLFDIDESCYRFHRSILCTLCDVSCLSSMNRFPI